MTTIAREKAARGRLVVKHGATSVAVGDVVACGADEVCVVVMEGAVAGVLTGAESPVREAAPSIALFFVTTGAVRIAASGPIGPMRDAASGEMKSPRFAANLGVRVVDPSAAALAAAARGDALDAFVTSTFTNAVKTACGQLVLIDKVPLADLATAAPPALKVAIADAMMSALQSIGVDYVATHELTIAFDAPAAPAGAAAASIQMTGEMTMPADATVPDVAVKEDLKLPGPIVKCPACGGVGVSFCADCGKPIPAPVSASAPTLRQCGSCKAPLTGAPKFCAVCGAKQNY